MSELHDTWHRLHAIDAAAMAAQPPASAEAIAAAEKMLKRPLPPAVAAMLRVSQSWGWTEEAFDTVTFLSPAEIVAQTLRPRDASLVLEVEDAATARVAAKVYGPGRTTFARTDYLFFQVDDEPPPGGRPGQVVSIDFEEGVVDVVAESVELFIARGLGQLKHALEHGVGEVPPDPVAQAAAAGVVIAAIDPATLPLPVPLPERKPLKQPKADGPLGATLLGIDAWLDAAMPPGGKRFKAGATAKKIRQFLSAGGHALPEALFPLFATFNGQVPQRVGLLPCPRAPGPALVLRDFEDVARGRDNNHAIGQYRKPVRDYVGAAAGVKDGYWRKDWWPVARSPIDDPRCQATVFVDFEPAPGGTPGQVVLEVVHVADDFSEQCERHVVAPSMQAWLDGVLADLQAGRLEFREGKGVVRSG